MIFEIPPKWLKYTMLFCYRFILAQLFCFLAVGFPLPVNADPELDSHRATFLRAEHALKKQDLVNYERLSKTITNYPLYPYLIYEALKQKIAASNDPEFTWAQIKQFEKKYPDFPFLNALQELWLTNTAKQKNWASYAQKYQSSKNEALQCHYYYAKYHITQDEAFLAKAKNLWLVGYSQPKACDLLFKTWQQQGGLSSQLIWERFKLALDNKNNALAKHLISQLPAKDRVFAKQWEKAVTHPELITQISKIQQASASPNIKAQMVTQVLRLLARKNAQKAATWWKANQNNFKFSVEQKRLIQRDIGVYLSHQKDPLATHWLANLSEEALDNTAHEWRVRLSLAQSDWPNVLKWINRLPLQLQEENSWYYWKARALEALGENAQANSIFQDLSQTRSYYGFLASARLGKPVSLQHQPFKLQPAIIERVNSLPAIQRFHELAQLERTALARVEWFRALDKMSEHEIIAAAKLAQKMKLHDFAILSMSKAKFKNDVYLRFPLAHHHTIVNHAKKHNLDPAWVFAVARQESAFYTHSISHAGARGLMQLLPTTASELAKYNQITYQSADSLHTPLTNVQLGTIYLKSLKKQMHNHAILATASYNAGPNRILRWLPSEPLEADIWIETIPYHETREYVKNVLTFTSIYRHRLGTPSSLTLVMKPIPGKIT